MPQLDPNTFIYQYAGIIVLLVFVYIILSYIILPIVLRLMLIRNLFLSTRQTLAELVNIVLPSQQHVISLKIPTRSGLVSNYFLSGLSAMSIHWLNLLLTNLGGFFGLGTRIINTAVATNNIAFVLNEFVGDYFILFLLVELEEINE